MIDITRITADMYLGIDISLRVWLQVVLIWYIIIIDLFRFCSFLDEIS